MNAPQDIGVMMRDCEWPGLVHADGSRWHYLDTAATAQKPLAVIDATVNAMDPAIAGRLNGSPITLRSPVVPAMTAGRYSGR